MYTATRTFTFEAAHRLTKLPVMHPCTNVHGHSYKVQIKIFSDKTDERGFVIDFGELKEVEKQVNKLFDHAILLNSEDHKFVEFFEGMGVRLYKFTKCDPTAENMAKEISIITKQLFPKFSCEVTVWETEKNFASYSNMN